MEHTEDDNLLQPAFATVSALLKGLAKLALLQEAFVMDGPLHSFSTELSCCPRKLWIIRGKSWIPNYICGSPGQKLNVTQSQSKISYPQKCSHLGMLDTQNTHMVLDTCKIWQDLKLCISSSAMATNTGSNANSEKEPSSRSASEVNRSAELTHRVPDHYHTDQSQVFILLTTL